MPDLKPGSRALLACAAMLLAACPSSTVTTAPPPPPAVATVTVSGASGPILVGGTVKLTATAADASGNALQRSPTWTTAAQAVATVGSDGTVTGVSAGTAAISATTDGISGSLTISVNNVVPVVGVVGPASVVAGSGALTLMVQGTGFIASSTVRWNGADRATTFVSATQLNATILAGDVAAVGIAQVTVSTPGPGGGVSNAQPFTVSAPANNPVPSLLSALPNTIAAGGAGFTVTVTGTNFVGSSVVRWNGLSRTTTFVSATQLAAQVTAADIAAVGGAQLSVFTPTPGGGVSNTIGFTITGAAVTAVAPILALAGGAGFTVTVTGTSFLATSVVLWNGQPRSTTFVNATQLSAQVTTADVATAGSGVITVQTPGSGISSGQSLLILGPSQSISAKSSSSCAISSTGALYCWGDNRFGYLGDGSTTQVQPAPVPLAIGKTFTSVEAEYAGSCGLVTGGMLYCWGPHDGISNSPIPIRVASTMTFTSFSRGGEHVCGISTDSQTYCWGGNTYGQNGDGTTITSGAPVLVSGGLTFVAVSGSADQSCGLIASGAAYCWGRNDGGELGHGDAVEYHVPVPVAGGHSFVAIAAGNPSCAIDRNGAAWCWGDNSQGAFGNGSTAGSNVPVPAATGLTLTSISVDSPQILYGGFACGVTVTGTGYCWGPNNNSGVLGDGQDTPSLLPMPVAGGQTFSTISAGQDHACGITTTGSAMCWGMRSYGYLGDGSMGYRTTPTAVAGGLTFSTLSLGVTHMCGLIANGDVYCWGDGTFGQLGNAANNNSPVPVKVGGNHHFISLGKTSGYTTCAVATDPAPPFNKTWCWGNNVFGDLGTGAAGAPASLPVAITGSLDVAALSGGAENIFTTTCALTGAMLAYCWGYDGNGQLGDGLPSNIAVHGTPTAVTGSHLWSMISLSGVHACGVTTSGAGYCWGDDQQGELGVGLFNLPNQSTPQLVHGGLTFTSISAGLFNSCGVTTTNDGWCWGEDAQTGTTYFSVASPQQITGYKFVTIQLQGLLGCGLTTALTAVCWGNNHEGEAGNGTFQTDFHFPLIAPVGSGMTFQQLFVGNAAACGLSGGQAFCWGDNTSDGLGVGQADHVSQPIAVSLAGVTFQVAHRMLALPLRALRR